MFCGPIMDYSSSWIDKIPGGNIGHRMFAFDLSESILQVTTPPSPMGGNGGMVTVYLSLNGRGFSGGGMYYNFTESAFIQSFYPSVVTEGSCFNLTMVVDNRV